MLDGLVWGLEEEPFSERRSANPPLSMGERVSEPSVVLHSWLGEA